jgi:hypothetical protein
MRWVQAAAHSLGVSFDVTGSYHFMLAAFAIALLVASGLMMGLGWYVYPPGLRPSPDDGGPRAAASPAAP